MHRDLPEGIPDAAPPGGWEGVDDEESRERDEEEADVQLLLAADPDAAEPHTIDPATAARPDDPAEGEAVRRGADPDLMTEPDRGEEH